MVPLHVFSLTRLLYHSVLGDVLMPVLAPLLNKISSRLENSTKHASQSAKLYADAIQQIGTAELLICRTRFLQRKFAGTTSDARDAVQLNNFVTKLMTQEEVGVAGAANGLVGKSITKLFIDSQVRSSNCSKTYKPKFMN